MRDPGLRNRPRAELQVGLLVLGAFVALVAGVLWISGAKLGGDDLSFFAEAAEAHQVTEGTRIVLLGVDVGQVTGVEIVGRHVVLGLEISHDGTLPRDTRAVIQPSGFLGAQVVALIPGDAEAPLTEGDTVQAGAEVGLQALAGELSADAQDVLERTEEILSEETAENIQTASRALAATLSDLQQLVDEQRATLASLIQNLESTSENLASATDGPHLEQTLAQIDSLTAGLAGASVALDSSSHSLASILAKVDAGEGSLGQLVNDERLYVQVAAAAENLQAATEEIALLAQDIRERPERYLGAIDISVF